MNISEHFEHQGKKQDKEHFIHLIQVALADGVIDDSEMEMLHRFGLKVGFTEIEISDLIESSSNYAYTPPYELFKRFEQVYDIVKMVLADGVVDKSEMRLAHNFALKSGFVDDEIPQLLDLLVIGIKERKDEEDLFTVYRKSKR